MKTTLKAILAFAEAQKSAFAEGMTGDLKSQIAFLVENLDDEFKEALESILTEEAESTEAFTSMIEKMLEATKAEVVTEAAAKIACLECDEVSTAKAWEKNKGTCPKCNKSTKGVAEEMDDADKDDKDSDDNEDKDDKKKKPKKEAVDLTEVKKMLEDVGVDEEKLSEFSAVLRQIIVETATTYAAEAEVTLKSEYAEKLETEKEALSVRLEEYAAKSAAEFNESNGKVLVDSNRLTKLEALFESVVGTLNDYAFTVSSEDSDMLSELRADLDTKKEALDEATDKLFETRQQLMLERVNIHRNAAVKGMKDGDKTRMFEMLEDIDFSTAEEFQRKSESIREKFFIVDNIKTENFIEKLVEDSNLETTMENNHKIKPKSLLGEIASVMQEG